MYSVFFPSIFWPISGLLKIRPFVKLDQKFLFTTPTARYKSSRKQNSDLCIAFYSLELPADIGYTQIIHVSFIISSKFEVGIFCFSSFIETMWVYLLVS